MKAAKNQGTGMPAGTGNAVPAAAPASGPETDPVREPAETMLHRIAVCAYEGTEEQLEKVWEKMTGETPVIIPAAPDADIRELLAEVIAIPHVADDFVLVPANCVPCSRVSFTELSLPTVYVSNTGERTLGSRLPIPFNKGKCVDMLPGDKEKTGTAEEFLSRYFKFNLNRTVEVGFSFGNYVTPVLRGNPCEHIVIEAFVRKKFVTASPEGYRAIAGLIDRYLLG